jgi:hypothetical protein
MRRFFRFPRGLLPIALLLSLALPARAEPVISEFLALNERNLADADGDYSDWIEVHNPDAAPLNLDGWYLTDSAAKKDKWKFPAVTIQPGGYLVVFASNKNRRDPTKPLHTNFSLDGSGEYLALVKPDGTTVVSEFTPTFAPQFPDISYGVTQPTAAGEAARLGFFRLPTPGARNGGTNALLLLERVALSRAPGPFTGTATLTLTGAAAGQRIRYVTAAPSTGGAVVADPTATSTLYTGPITLRTSTMIRAAVFSADDAQRGFSTAGHYVRIANSGTNRLDTFASQLPLLVLDTHGTGPLLLASGDKPSWVYSWNRPATGNTTLTATPAIANPGMINVRGSSSAEFPKKSYNLRPTDPAGEPRALGFHGLPPFDSWALVGPWAFDRTYIHNVFTYTVSNRIGRWAPRTQLVEVFVNANGGDLDNTDYAGVYVLTDRLSLDPQRVAINPIDRDDTGDRSITGGYVLKIDAPDPDEYSFATRRNYPVLPSQICLDFPKAAVLPPAQRDYIRGYVQAFEDALYTDQAAGFKQRTHLDYIDRPSWIDHHLLNVLTQNVDAFYRSAYLTKDRQGRLVAGPIWDNDRAMHGGDDRSEEPDRWNGGGGATELWKHGWWGLLARDPEFMQAWVDRWQSLRKTEFATDRLLALVDSIAAQVGAAAAARDAARWPDNALGDGNTPRARFGGTWQGEIDNMKSWLTRRLAWIDSEFIRAPTVSRAAGTITFTPPAGAQIAYNTDGTDPRVVGGGLSFAARLSSTAVTLPDTLDLQVRTYYAGVDLAQVPGSRWSGVEGGSRSSPLIPGVRLANLSSRGFVGSDENVMIAGVVVNDTAGKQYLARAVGPALGAFGVGDALAAPVLTILDNATGREIARNAGWGTSRDEEEIADLSSAVGAFPFSKNSRDSAILIRLPYGQFTLQVSSASAATGIALAELYEIDPGVGRTLNLSTRGRVRAGDEGMLIGGVVVSGPSPKRLLVRAVGPTLGLFGVSATLPDPVLTVFSGSAPLATNDNWGTTAASAASAADIASAAAKVGAFALPTGSLDSAVLTTVPPGAYTIQVAGKARAEGVILFEIYEVP